VEKVFNSIREYGYNLKTTPIVFVGGGAVVMKNFAKYDGKNISYILDIKANDRGYEQLATIGLKSMRKMA
jgi:plasmid segregation protein ParM